MESNEIYNCYLCHKILDQPILLPLCPCELNVCKEHLVGGDESRFKKKRSSFECIKCSFLYELPLSFGLEENKTLKDAIEHLAYMTEEEKELKKDVDRLFEEIENITSQFNYKIEEFSLTQSDHFMNLRCDIDIRRETLIENIHFGNMDDDSSEKLISDLNEQSSDLITRLEDYEKEFRQNFEKNVKPHLISFDLEKEANEFIELLRGTNLTQNPMSLVCSYSSRLRDIQRRYDNFKLFEYDLKKTKLDQSNSNENDLGELVLLSGFFKGFSLFTFISFRV
jgi:vacuolar-type H+-ATPase subunit I/STV1